MSSKVKLTEAVVARFECPAGTAQAHLWDTVQPGLGVRALPAYTKDGKLRPGKKTWVVHGRVAGSGLERRITLGDVATVPLAPRNAEDDTGDDPIKHSARERARRARLQMGVGVDPVAAQAQATRTREAAAAEATARAVTLRQVADHYIANKKTRNGPLKANTVRDIEVHVTKSFATWEHRPIASITRDMCEARHAELARGGLTGKRPAPHRARGACVVLRALINWAMEKYRVDGKRLIDENPVNVLRGQMAPPNARDMRVPLNRVGHVWEALRIMRATPARPTTHTQADALAFMLLTGGRESEVLGLTWDRVQLDDNSGSWHLPTPKNGNPVTFPLSAPARALLAARPRRKGCDYVFPAAKGNKPIGIPRGEPMRAVIAAAGCQQNRHSLRATFTTLALTELRIEKWRVDLLTNHTLRGDVTLNNYTETSDLRYLAPEAERIGAWIIEQAGIAAGRNVVKMPEKKRA